MRYQDIISELGVRRQPRDNGYILAPCPMHEDSHPSFSINVRTGRWWCWSSCGRGDIVDLVVRVRGWTRDRAREYVGTQEPLPVSSDELAKRIGAMQTRLTDDDVDIPYLLDTSSLKRDRWPLWWPERGFNADDWRSWDMWFDHETGDAVIPVRDMDDMLRGVIRRKHPLSTFRYLYPPNFKRSDYLFGENRVAGGRIWLVEGPLDCIWAWHCGIPSLAIMGSFVSAKQYMRLARMGVDEITLMFDADKAGISATTSFLDKSSVATVAVLPDGKDPQDIKDPSELRQIAESTVPLYKFVLKKGLANADRH